MKNRFNNLGIVLASPLIIAFSWLSIHILAIFGFFVSIAYVLWWLVAPKYATCLMCRAKSDKEYCPFCKKQIIKNQGMSPRSFTSAVLNGGLILVLSVVSVGIVFVESQVLAKLGFPSTTKSASFIIPSKGQFRVGEIFPVKIDIDNIENSINAVQADIGFDPERVEVVDISTANSFANIFIQEEINNEGGWSRLTGGLANPGFFGKHATFGTIYFRAKNPGLVKINFLSSSMVLANDGRGTNILKDLPAVSYLILPDKISDDEEKEQKKLISKLSVLGAADKNGQLKFNEEEKSILGVQAEKEIQEKKKINTGNFLLGLVESTDRFILTFWQKIAGSIF